jgi:hypothetical protein
MTIFWPRVKRVVAEVCADLLIYQDVRTNFGETWLEEAT